MKVIINELNTYLKIRKGSLESREKEIAKIKAEAIELKTNRSNK